MDVRVKCVQHYKEFRPGDIYVVEAWVARQLAEAHKVIIIKDMNTLEMGQVKRSPGRPRKYPVIDGITK